MGVEEVVIDEKINAVVFDEDTARAFWLRHLDRTPVDNFSGVQLEEIATRLLQEAGPATLNSEITKVGGDTVVYRTKRKIGADGRPKDLQGVPRDIYVVIPRRQQEANSKNENGVTTTFTKMSPTQQYLRHFIKHMEGYGYTRQESAEIFNYILQCELAVPPIPETGTNQRIGRNLGSIGAYLGIIAALAGGAILYAQNHMNGPKYRNAIERVAAEPGTFVSEARRIRVR